MRSCNGARLRIAKEEHIEDLFRKGVCSIDVPDVCELLKSVSDTFSKNSLKDVFNSDDDFFKNSSVSLSVEEYCNKKFRDYEYDESFIVGEDKEAEFKVVKNYNESAIHVSFIGDRDSKSFVHFFLQRELSNLILSSFIPNSFVITSERTGAAMFYKDLDSQAHSVLDHLLELKGEVKGRKKLDPFALMEKMRSRYSLPIRSNIDHIRYAQEAIKNKSELTENDACGVLDKLKDVICGEYKTLASGVIYVPNDIGNGKEVKLPMHMTSSATKSLYLLDLYLRHIAKIGDVLIIDEPELCLHPDAQRMLARLLVRVVNSGIKLVITTHSDHLLRELNSLIMLSNDSIDKEEKDEILSRHSLSNYDLIKPDSVRAYVTSSSTNNIHEMNVDELGIHLKLFNDEIKDAADLSKEVYYLIS